MSFGCDFGSVLLPHTGKMPLLNACLTASVAQLLKTKRDDADRRIKSLTVISLA